MSLKNLYQTIILQHNKQPFHFRKMQDADLVLEAYNQLCGDQFKIFIKLNKKTISDISFHGYGCAISKASTSVLVQTLLKKDLAEAKKITAQFLQLVQGEDLEEVWHEDFLAFQAAKDFPTRMKCAILSWEEIEALSLEK